MMRGIDTSNWQGVYEPAETGVDFVITKATEGTGFVDPICDTVAQKCLGAGIAWGFYHFAGNSCADEEARFFVDNCAGYFGLGVPVLDWEGEQDVAWVNEFVGKVHDLTGVWCVIYANPWRFNQGGVEVNCGRWVASYPNFNSPSHENAERWECPEADGLVVAWQFCSDGKLPGIDGDVDLDLFYGDRAAWAAYVAGDRNGSEAAPGCSCGCNCCGGE